MMERVTKRLLGLTQRISDLWFSVEHRIWKRLCVAYLAAFVVLLVASIAFGITAAVCWRDGLWIEAILIASTLVSMIASGIFGVIVYVKEGQKYE